MKEGRESKREERRGGAGGGWPAWAGRAELQGGREEPRGPGEVGGA
jgi:hypothetical protein